MTENSYIFFKNDNHVYEIIFLKNDHQTYSDLNEVINLN